MTQMSMSTGIAIDHIKHRDRTGINQPSSPPASPFMGRQMGHGWYRQESSRSRTNFCSNGQLNSHHISSSSGLTLIRAMDLRFSDERLHHCAIQAPGTDHLRTRQHLQSGQFTDAAVIHSATYTQNYNHSFQMQFTIILETSVQQQQRR